MNEDQRDQMIQAYLEGKMGGEELQKFTSEFESNPELAREIKRFKEIELGLRSIGVDNLKEEIKDWEKEYLIHSSETVKVRTIRTYYSVAAIILLLVVAGIFFFLNRQPDYSNLYSQNYTPYEDMILDRGDMEEYNESPLKAGMEAYNMKKYELASKNLSAYLEQMPEKYGVALYLGISEMELNQTKSAEKDLMLAQKDPMFTQQAQWYLCLLYLKSNQPDNALDEINGILRNPDHYKFEDALKLKKVLK
jgi:hypothetical protein